METPPAPHGAGVASSSSLKPTPSSNYKTMATDSSRHTSPERAGRTSFSSIRENDEDLAQTFTASKVSSYTAPADELALVDDDESPSAPSSAARGNMIEAQYFPPVTQPGSRLHGNWFPANGFKGWKQINVKGKLASKSFGDLQVLNVAWHATPTPQPTPKRRNGARSPGDAPIERLPVELLTAIINLLVLDIPPNGLERRNIDLMSLLLTSKTLHTATLSSLYNRITIPHSRIFQKFLSHVNSHPSLGTIVRRIDFSHFNPSTLFSTASERSQARNLTSETLRQCLELTPLLQEFLAQEYIDDDLDAAVLRKLFFGLDRLQALDFCGCSSALFKTAFAEVVSNKDDWPVALTVKRLSLHKCMTLPATVLDTLMPRLTRLTHLDVAGTRITDDALWSIPATARITHLNLAKCKLLSAPRVIEFIRSHPAVAESLEFLSLATDARSHELFDEQHLNELIPILPKTLKSLSLKGSKMNASHIDLLLPLTKHLEELALGRSLKLRDVQRLFIPQARPGTPGSDGDVDMTGEDAEIAAQLAWVPHTVRYLDLSDMWGGELDASTLFNDSVLLQSVTEPLGVVEFSADVFKKVRKSTGALARYRWRVSEIHVRSWLVREGGDNEDDNGARHWKMGARYWGMRKVPVAKAEVGGMYGSYMFGRTI
ncbi:hypothetical protein RB597_005780 [Gaeumannomyces tritici]